MQNLQKGTNTVIESLSQTALNKVYQVSPNSTTHRTVIWTSSVRSVLAVAINPDVKQCMGWEAIGKTSRRCVGLIKLMGNPINVVVVTPEFDLWLVRAAACSWEIKVIWLQVCVGLGLCVFLNVASRRPLESQNTLMSEV